MSRAPQQQKQTLQQMAAQVAGGKRGLYDVEDIERTEPETLARVLNGLVSRVNFDHEREMRRRTRNNLVMLIVGAFALGCVVSAVTTVAVLRPVDRLVDRLDRVLIGSGAAPR